MSEPEIIIDEPTLKFVGRGKVVAVAAHTSTVLLTSDEAMPTDNKDRLKEAALQLQKQAELDAYEAATQAKYTGVSQRAMRRQKQKPKGKKKYGW